MTNRVALITGGARGIGLGIAQSLANEGYDLAINGVRSEADAADALDQLRQAGHNVVYCQGDVSDPEARQSIISTARDHFSAINVLVNNAGITSPGRKDILEADEESFDRVIGVNLKGPYFLTQAIANWMIESTESDPNHSACIINVSSVSGQIVSTNRGDYCLTKAAIAMATKLWAVRMADYGIPVYEVQPGVIRSDMTAGVTEKYDRLIGEGLTLDRRWGTIEDVGRAVATLARGDIPYATGQVLNIDGGMMIRSM